MLTVSSQPTVAGNLQAQIRVPVAARVTGVSLLLALCIFASKTAWYDLRIAFESFRGFAGTRAVLMLYVGSLVPFIIWALFDGLAFVWSSRLMRAFLFMNVYGLALAAFNDQLGSLFTYQDLMKLTFVPAGFGLVYISRPASMSRVLELLALVVIGYQLVKLALFLKHYHGAFGLYYGGVMDVYPFCYFFSKHVSGEKRSSLFFGMLSLVVLLLGQKRTVAVCCVIVVAYVLWRYGKRLALQPSSYVALGVVVISYFGFSENLVNIAEQRLQRITETDIHTAIGEESPRWREVRIILEDMAYRGPMAVTFGMGHGAIFEDEVVDPVTGEAINHSVHFTPAAMFLRYGLMGIGFFILTAVSIVFCRETTHPTWLHFSDVVAMKAFCIASIFGSFAVYELLDNLVVGSFFGAMHLANLTRK